MTSLRGPSFLYGDPTHRPVKWPLKTRWGYGGRILDLTPSPGVLTGEICDEPCKIFPARKRDREKRGIRRKGNFIIDLQCYKLFDSTVGTMHGATLFTVIPRNCPISVAFNVHVDKEDLFLS